MSKKHINVSEEDENAVGPIELEFPSAHGTGRKRNIHRPAPNLKLPPINEQFHEEATSTSTTVSRPKRVEPKTIETIDASTLPAANPHGRRALAFDGVLVDSPQRPPRKGTVAPASPPSPTIPRNRQGREQRSMDQDSEAAEVAKGLQDAEAQGQQGYSDEGSDGDQFPEDQFLEPPDSEDERATLRKIVTKQRASEHPAEHGELSSIYSRALGEALKELTPEPTQDHSRAPSRASEATKDSFEHSTSSEEYLSGLNDALSAETDGKQRAQLERERATKLKAREEKAQQYAEEQAQWRQATKGKGREMGNDGEGEMPKPVVTRLTKAQTERIKQMAEEERERFGQLAREMRVPVELVLEAAHRQTAKSRGGPWNDWLRLYAAKHPDHGELSTPRRL